MGVPLGSYTPSAGPDKWPEMMAPIIITLVRSHAIRDPVGFLTLTVETYSTPQF